ncbi:hypothetical protein [Flavobacterium sp.]|uniref:hypothetical protein n=1 Tax=Flavobacterium sp. TaxID=239 RepID=UPI0039E4379C
MNIFRRIKDIFERRKALREIYDDINTLDEVLLEKRLEIFSEMITPRLAEIGLRNWDGKYFWFSDFNQDGIKHVVHYETFKYFGGSFSFGNCYDFVPTISSKKLVYHRTDKSTKIIYYKKFPGWQQSDDNDSIRNIDKISTVNEEKLRKSIQEVFDRNLPQLKQWFDQNQTLEQNISNILSEKDVEEKKEKKRQIYRVISLNYILAFLYAKKSDFGSAQTYIEKHYDRKILNEQNRKIEFDLVNEKIQSLKNATTQKRS